MVIYFSKLNLVSEHVFKVEKDLTQLRRILSFLFYDLNGEMEYTKEDFYCENDEVKVNTIEYTLKIINQTKNDILEGYMYKKSRVFFNDEDPVSGKLKRKSVPNTEAIRFYFDVYHETVGFYTTNRFGYKEFNEAFVAIINNCTKKNNRDFVYSMQLRTEGMDIKEITSQLKKIDNIKELRFKFQPPNPDEEFLNNIQERGNNIVDEMEEANATGISYVFTSKSARGINIDSPLVQENIDKIQELNELTGSQKAISKGYTSVEATRKDGKVFTTADQKPVRVIIESIEEFFETCKEVIETLI